MEGLLERQVIRTALVLAAASAHGKTADSIVDLREEAGQLLGFYVNTQEKTDEFAGVLRQWCDNAGALVQRLKATEQISEQAALNATAAILRLQLVLAQQFPQMATRQAKNTPLRHRRSGAPSTQHKQSIIVEYVARHPHLRTKELVSALAGTFSPRTIKRCLKDLGERGILQRTKHDGGSVSYSVDTQE